ncbi:hypothetical protein QM012_001701 [Aureobasidium pullulans]|uniref:Uncharacterized protein n=1 Tax=Aureobasidium pullulans TaxID=5580 RepID=A0ABR0TC94_AURPU
MIYPGYRPTARTSSEAQEAPKNIQQPNNGVPVWSKAFLITFWTIQIIVCIIGWGVGGLALGTKSLLDDGDYTYNHNVDIALSVGGGIWIAWASASFILIVTEIVMFSRQNLKAWFAVTCCCVKTTLWLVLFVIAIYDTVADSASGLALLILGVFLIAFLIPLIYSAVKLHRQRKAVQTPIEPISV